MLVFVLDSKIKYDYVTWFEKKYFPADSVSSYWQQRDLVISCRLKLAIMN